MILHNRLTGIKKQKIWPIGLCGMLLLLLCPYPASAGLLNAIYKFSKAIDIDIPLKKVKLPDDLSGLSIASIKPDINGQWNIIQSDGVAISLNNLIRHSEKNLKPQALVIRESDLPKELEQFSRIPKNWPVFIQTKKGRQFELHRSDVAALTYKNVRIAINNIADIRDGIWLLQRPFVGKAIRFVQLDNSETNSLSQHVYGSGFKVEAVAENQLIDSMRSIKYQTLVLSGKVVDGRLMGKGKGVAGVSIQELQQAAAVNDIRLVILEAEKPALLLKKISGSMQENIKDNGELFNSTGDFINRLHNPGNKNYIDVSTGQSGDNQIAIQLLEVRKPTVKVTEKKTVASSEGIADQLPVHLLLHAASMHVPDRRRSKELDDRIIEGMPSWLQFYVIISSVLGVTALGTSRSLWRGIWAMGERSEYKYLLGYLLSGALHWLFFLLLFIPAAGFFSFIWSIILTVYKVLSFMVFKPVRWLYQHLSACVVSVREMYR